jgi:hypothetical protein
MMQNMFKINGNPEKFADLEVFHKLSQQFLPYAQKKLGFDKPVGINLISDPQNAKNPLGKTAYYDPNKLEVTVFVDKRHVKDILRSMSHELVHHTQNCRGEFDGEINTGPGYAQEDGHMREMEKEAYLEGQLLLRDFEDNLKKENQQMSRINEVSDEVKARTEPKDKANKADFLPKNVRDEINAEEGDEAQIDEANCGSHKRDDDVKKTKWKNPEGETGVVSCDPACTEKEAADKIRSKAKAPKPKKKPEKKKKKRERVRLEEGEPEETSYEFGDDEGSTIVVDKPEEKKKEKNENWTRKNKDQLLFERLLKKWAK